MASTLSNSWRACQRLPRQRIRIPPSTRHFSTGTTLRNVNNGGNPLRSPGAGAGRAKVDEDIAKSRRVMLFSGLGMAACAIGMYGVIKMDMFGLDAVEAGKDNKETKPNEASTVRIKPGALRADGPPGFPSDGGPSVIPLQGQDNIEQVPTGNSTIPYFPSTMRLPSLAETESKKTGDELSTTGGDEYQLIGLGIRTVSFLKIQVYVVGLYVAKADITELQQRLVRTAMHPPSEDSAAGFSAGADAATSLVPPERAQLKALLLDPERGDAAWTALLKESGIRTAFRIVPTRNTDFMHLRDGWVRGITGRAQRKTGSTQPGEFQDAEFGSALNDFKALFGGGQRKSVPKGQTLILLRQTHGALDALFQADPSKPILWMGRVKDERVSRLVWLNYLAGKNVSSEGARNNIVDGLMTVVERPVGTVVQRVL